MEACGFRTKNEPCGKCRDEDGEALQPCLHGRNCLVAMPDDSLAIIVTSPRNDNGIVIYDPSRWNMRGKRYGDLSLDSPLRDAHRAEASSAPYRVPRDQNSRAIIDFRSRRYILLPTRVGGLHEMADRIGHFATA